MFLIVQHWRQNNVNDMLTQRKSTSTMHKSKEPVFPSHYHLLSHQRNAVLSECAM